MATMLQRIAKSLVPKSTVETVVLCLIVGILTWLGWDVIRNELATRRGLADAQADIDRGEITYRLRGLARTWQRDAIEIAKRDYGITIIRTGGCLCSGADCTYDRAYNRAVQDHLQRMLGFDPVLESFELARSNWEKQHRAPATDLEGNSAEQGDPRERPMTREFKSTSIAAAP